MRKLFGFLCIFALLLAGCEEKYDDSALSGRVDDLEQRVQALEELCAQMNTNISSLQTLVNALQERDYVTNVAPVMQGSEVVGYTIAFEKAESITIYNGEKGADGSTPTIGVKQDTDGVYYWTLDGEWLTDDGEKIGAQGIMPQLKIENEYWFVSYNNGTSWTQLGKATGEKGDSGISIFEEVTQDENNVYFMLTGGEIVTLPKRCALDIVFAETEEIICMPGESVEVAYTVTGGDDRTKVECLGDRGWAATVSGGLEGVVTVSAPDEGLEGKVLVLVTNGAGQVVMKALRFEKSTLLVSDVYEVEYPSGYVDVEVTTNLDYEVYIPEEAQEWLSYVPTSRALRTDILRFQITENQTNSFRETIIELRNANGECLKAITIIQHNAYIVFADPLVKEICIREFDTSGDGELSYDEAAAVTTNDMRGIFEKTAITSFDELQYFTGLNDIIYMFDSCFYLQSVVLPPTITIRVGSFSYSALTSIEVPENTKTIDSYAFLGCKNLNTVILPQELNEILWNAFQNCTSLTTIELPEKLELIGESAFGGCTNLTTIYCKAVEPPRLEGSGWFNGCPMETLYVPIGSKEKYQNAEGWKDIPHIVETDFNANN